jgi:hypothetical protein
MSKTSYLNPFKAIKYLFDKPQTLRYPFETKEIADRYRGFQKRLRIDTEDSIKMIGKSVQDAEIVLISVRIKRLRW